MLSLTACDAGWGGAAATAAPTASPAASVPATPRVPPPEASPAPTTPPQEPVPTPPAGPPGASLVLGPGLLVPGDLGTYTWIDIVSDAPWLPGAGPIPVQAGGTLLVTIEDDPPVVAWEVLWAPLRGAGPEPPVDGADGTGPILFGAPPSGGWSVRLEVSLGEARRATYYWRLDVRP
jgi:hypothetical protein